MRRAPALFLAACLLLAMPLASAAGKHASAAPSLPTSDPSSSSSSSSSAASPRATTTPMADVMTFLALGAGGVGLLGMSIALARRARGPRVRRPRKRSYEAGRALGRSTGVASAEEALARLRQPDVGRVTGMGAADGRVRVAVARRRGEPCDMVAGYLTGLFEAAWACDVAVRHDRCSGRKRAAACEYDIIRAAHRDAAAWTRGSAAATGRSPKAPGGLA